MTVMYRNREGEPITMDEWQRLWDNDDYKIIDQTWSDDVMISTVWLGLVHIGGWFETLIFGGAHDGEMWRYSSEEQARKGHRRAVRVVEGGVG